MAKLTAFLLAAIAFATLGQSTALKCYTCDQACKVADAAKKDACGGTAGSTHEAFCFIQVPKEKVGTDEAIRKCLIENKGQKPTCPEAAECKSCTTDFCNDKLNAAPSIGSNAALMGVTAALLVVKFLY